MTRGYLVFAFVNVGCLSFAASAWLMQGCVAAGASHAAVAALFATLAVLRLPTATTRRQDPGVPRSAQR